jgi:phospholipase/lecithinase/hemolysin
MTDIWNNPSTYLNGTAPLNVTGFVTDCVESECSSKSSWDSYMWYDELHPSEQTDRVIAREFLNVVGGGSKWATYWSDH